MSLLSSIEALREDVTENNTGLVTPDNLWRRLVTNISFTLENSSFSPYEIFQAGLELYKDLASLRGAGQHANEMTRILDIDKYFSMAAEVKSRLESLSGISDDRFCLSLVLADLLGSSATWEVVRLFNENNQTLGSEKYVDLESEVSGRRKKFRVGENTLAFFDGAKVCGWEDKDLGVTFLFSISGRNDVKTWFERYGAEIFGKLGKQFANSEVRDLRKLVVLLPGKNVAWALYPESLETHGVIVLGLDEPKNLDYWFWKKRCMVVHELDHLRLFGEIKRRGLSYFGNIMLELSAEEEELRYLNEENGPDNLKWSQRNAIQSYVDVLSGNVQELVESPQFEMLAEKYLSAGADPAKILQMIEVVWAWTQKVGIAEISDFPKLLGFEN